jgi:hypothetical protein
LTNLDSESHEATKKKEKFWIIQNEIYLNNDNDFKGIQDFSDIQIIKIKKYVSNNISR